MDKVKKSELESLLGKINKSLKSDGKVYFGDKHPPITRISSGVPALDYLLGGGLPHARCVEIFGPESSAKTLLAMTAMATIQKKGKVAVLVKGEEYDKDWADKNGVNNKELVIVEASCGDLAFETAATLLESGLVGIIVFDSIQGFGTEHELKGGVDSNAYAGGGSPQLWGRLIHRVYAASNQGHLDNTAVVIISQVRAKIGGYSKGLAAMEGQPSQIHSIQHWKAVSIRCRVGEAFWTEKDHKGSIYAREFKLRCEKNKTAATVGMTASYTYRFREWEGLPPGLDNAATIFDLACEHEFFTNKGAWYYLDGKQFAQGAETAIDKLRQNQKLMTELWTDVLTTMGSK